MQTLTLGRSDITISAIVMGTWQAGKKMWAGIDDTETSRAIRAAFDAGITTFDTAEAYGDGHAERILGRALADVRGEAILASKVFANHLAHDQMLRACEGSLKNLGTDTIDLYQIHWPAGSFRTPKVPIAETMGALNTLKDQGKIRAIGVSNFNSAQIAEAAQWGQIDAVQPPYSLFWRQAETEILPYCREAGITVLAYSPMAQGLLTGKFGPNHQFARQDNRKQNRLMQPEHYQRVQAALAELKPLAEKRGISLAQLALAWIVSQPNCCAIAGARNAGQITATAAAGDLTLAADEMRALDAISRQVTDHLDDNPVQWAWGR